VENRQLEREIRESRERLQGMVEEYETAVEELKSSNEELVSVNEELQSTNEELEASKEELQSLNEELHTVNAELNSKVEALDHANSDLQNLFESTDIATIFLDTKLTIRSFTPAVTRVFNILPGDRGRPITDLSSRLKLDNLTDDVAAVLAGAAVIERHIADADGGTNYLVRIAPYHGVDQRTEGAVVSFVDVTTLTNAEAKQRLLVAELQHRTRNLLGIVRSIARQTTETAGSTAEFTEKFGKRLAALSRVQDVLSTFQEQSVSIADLVNNELGALGADGQGGRVTVGGPEVTLRNSSVQTLALALHELATNALKYGSLVPGIDRGHLDVSWNVTEPADSRQLVLNWVESGVPKRRNGKKPVQIGYGRRLLEEALPYQLGAKTRYEEGPDGIHCRIEIPLDR